MQHKLPGKLHCRFIAVLRMNAGRQLQACAAATLVGGDEPVPLRHIRRIAHGDGVFADRQRIADLPVLNHDVPVVNPCFTQA